MKKYLSEIERREITDQRHDLLARDHRIRLKDRTGAAIAAWPDKTIYSEEWKKQLPLSFNPETWIPNMLLKHPFWIWVETKGGKRYVRANTSDGPKSAMGIREMMIKTDRWPELSAHPLEWHLCPARLHRPEIKSSLWALMGFKEKTYEFAPKIVRLIPGSFADAATALHMSKRPPSPRIERTHIQKSKSNYFIASVELGEEITDFSALDKPKRFKFIKPNPSEFVGPKRPRGRPFK